MVMLEGVSYSDGSIVGDIVERGSFRSVRDFLLSDRWFDYEKFRTSSSVVLTTQSGLARAVQEYVARIGGHLRIPLEPRSALC